MYNLLIDKMERLVLKNIFEITIIVLILLWISKEMAVQMGSQEDFIYPIPINPLNYQ